MKIFHNQRGSSHLVLFVALAVVVGVALVGYKVIKNTETNPAATASTTQAVTIPTTIKTKADLVQASQALDNTAIDSNVNPSQLDSDLNALL